MNLGETVRFVMQDAIGGMRALANENDVIPNLIHFPSFLHQRGFVLYHRFSTNIDGFCGGKGRSCSRLFLRLLKLVGKRRAHFIFSTFEYLDLSFLDLIIVTSWDPCYSMNP